MSKDNKGINGNKFVAKLALHPNGGKCREREREKEQVDSSHREQPTSQIFVRTEFQNIDWNVLKWL